jgi:pSer/pThr/pTyr-binding forkhead associated (FHA) protein
MSPALVLFLVRILLALLLYAFVGGVVYLIWRDVQQARNQAKAREGLRGRLILIANGLPSPQVGDYFPLLPVTSIGRAPTNTITIPDETASLEHSLISLRSGKWWLEDLGSRNGTLLNGVVITAPTVISGGDLIGLGQAQFKLEFG